MPSPGRFHSSLALSVDHELRGMYDCSKRFQLSAIGKRPAPCRAN